MPIIKNVHLGRVLILLLSITAAACASSGAVAGNAPRPRPFPGATLPPTGASEAGKASEAGNGVGEGDVGSPAPLASSTLSTLVQAALDLRGTPYRNGGSDPSGFDCSGFVQWIFNAVGVRLPREVRDQFGVGEKEDLDEVQPGDLIFFETVSRGASHVGMAIGGDQFVHAPSSTGVVRVERFTTPYWATRFVGARRVATDTTKTD
jgi:cell wall-associated NlpC family hydrolase